MVNQISCEIICVGTELLLGNIINTNAQFLSEQLASIGVNVFYQTTVGDNKSRIIESFKVAFNRGADIIITTGGLGPTDDDITKEASAEFFNLHLHMYLYIKMKKVLINRKIFYQN